MQAACVIISLSKFHEMKEDRIIRVKDAAKILKVSAATIYKWCNNGTIPYRQVGRTFYFDRLEIEALVLNKEIAA